MGTDAGRRRRGARACRPPQRQALLRTREVHGSLIPPDGRHNRAYFRTGIELSESPLDGKTGVDGTESTIVGEFECTSLNAEGWLRIETDCVDWAWYLASHSCSRSRPTTSNEPLKKGLMGDRR